MNGTLIGVFFEAVARREDSRLFVRRVGDAWDSVTGAHALADVESLGLGLAALGVGHGDRVALVSESRYEWPIVDLATLGLGAVLVPIYPTLTAPQTRMILDDSGARVLVVSTAAQLTKLREVLASLPAIEHIIVIDDAAVAAPREQTLAQVMAAGRELRQRDPLQFRSHASQVSGGDLATIIYTSGTTGDPKGVMLTHANILSNVDACLQVVDLGPTDLALSFLPLCHIFERMGGLYAMLRAGAVIAYARNLDTVAVDVTEVKPTIINGVPRFYEKVHARVLENGAKLSPLARRLFHWGLAQGARRAQAHFRGERAGGPALWLADRLVLGKVRERMGGHLRLCVSGGAALASETMEFFFSLGIPVIEGYGLTETSPVICLNVPGEERPGSVGKPVPGVDVRIGELGEILTRGPHVMRGYYHHDDATREALRDGWFHTGDVGRIDETGRLFITDRLKDLLVLAGGKKVAPQPIEVRLKKSAWVSEPVLLGDKRPYVVCLVAPDFARLEAEAGARGWDWSTREQLVALPQVKTLFEDAIAEINATLAPFETIKRFAVLDHELTQENGMLTATLKVKRRAVATQHAGVIEGLYAGHTTAG